MASRSSSSLALFSPRRRTAVVLAGEGVQAAYLAGVMRALDAAGVRMDLVMGRGVGALVAAFSAFHAEDKIVGEDGVLSALERDRPYRVSPLYRLAAISLGTSFAVFLAPALLGVFAILAFPIQAVLRQWRPGSAPSGPDFLSLVAAAAEPYYFPAIALPVILLFLVVALRTAGRVWSAGSNRRGVAMMDALGPAIELVPLARVLERRLWQLVRGTSTEELPQDRRELSEAYVRLLNAGLGQHGFRELVFYALDTDSGDEVPFVVLKNRFAKNLGAGDRNEARASGTDRGSRGEPIDLAGEGAGFLFDALLASLSPPGLVREVGIKLPRDHEFGGEVHRFASSLGGSGSVESVVADAAALGAEQVLYVTGASREDRLSGSIWERVASRALRISVDAELAWARSASGVPVFVIRPDSERLSPFAFSGKAQLGGDRLTASALVAQGERDAERTFIRPVLGEELPPMASESTIPIDRDWQAGPKEL